MTIDPADIGRQYDPVIRVNSQSGKGGVAFLVENELGFRLPRRLQIAFSRVIQKVTDSTGVEISSGEVGKHFVATYVEPGGPLVYQTHTPLASAEEDVERFRFDVVYKSQAASIEGQGSGPLDALVHALTEHYGLAFDIVDYQEHALEAGSDSVAAAYILAKAPGGEELFGVGRHKSITKASLKALVAAINRGLSNLPPE